MWGKMGKSSGMIIVLILCILTVVHPFVFHSSVTSKYLSAVDVFQNQIRYSSELFAKKKGSKLISDDFLSSLDSFDETPAATKVAVAPAKVAVAPVSVPVVAVDKKQKEIVADAADSSEAEAVAESGDVKKKKKKRDKSKKDYFSNVDLEGKAEVEPEVESEVDMDSEERKQKELLAAFVGGRDRNDDEDSDAEVKFVDPEGYRTEGQKGKTSVKD
jgi:hypothetical protein